MNIRNRITQFLWTLVAHIRCSKGNILIGRVSGAGPAQEITIGSGLSISGTTLSATGSEGPPILIRTSLQGPPTVPQYIDVVSIDIGSASYDPAGRIPFLEMESGAPKFYRGGNYPTVTVFWDGTTWFTSVSINEAAGVQWFGDGGEIGAVPQFDWLQDSGGDFTPSGGIEITYGPQVSADFVGQWCRVGDASPFDWYQWDGEFWVKQLQNSEGLLTVSELTATSIVRTGSIQLLSFGSGYYGYLYAPNGMTQNAGYQLPQKSGWVGILDGYANSAAANAAVSVGDSWWDTTLKKVRTRMS